jgi:hypothetical protein
MKENLNQLNLKLSDSKTAREFKDPGFIRSEVNFIRLPFFVLSRNGIKNQGEIEYKDSINRNNEKFDILWRVTANVRYGHPGPFDKKAHKAIEFLISQKGFPVENPITFSFYELCKLMNINNSGKTKRMIKESLIRTKLAGIESRGAFYYKGEKRWIDDIFNLYDRVTFVGERLPNGEVADKNYIFLSDWYLKSLNSFYVKPLDYDYYCSLQSTLSGRLYEFLSIQFYGLHGKPYSIEYHKLCQLLPIAEQKYISKAKENLSSAHRELHETKFLTQVRWRETGKSKWILTYYPGERMRKEFNKIKLEEQLELELILPEEIEAIDSKTELPNDDVDVIKQLTQIGINNITVKKLVNSYPVEQIRKQIEIFNWLKERKSPLVEKNPAGFLRKSIEENYEAPADFIRKQKKELIEQKNAQEMIENEKERARLDEIQRQIDDYRERLDEQEQQLLRQEAMELIECDKAIKKEFVGDILIRAKESEIIRKRLGLGL